MKINILTDGKIKNIICVFLLFIITIGIFKYTIRIRKPWYGTLSAGHHQWLSGSTLKFSKNWYREGVWYLKFGMIGNPGSIEFPNLLSRKPYFSYPPGRIFPIYMISKLRKHEPTPALLMKYNLLNHFLIAFFLSLIIFFFLLQLKFGYLNSFILSVVPISLELLLPAPLYWHQNVFGSDQAVILPFVLFIFFEIIRGNIKNRKVSNITIFFQNLVLFYGFLTDWLFVFIAITVYIKRILNGEINRRDIYSFTKTSVKYWFPPTLALSLFTFQLYSLHGFPRIIRRFLFHSGLGPGGEKYTANFYNMFWEGHIAQGYGEVAIGLLWGSLFLFAIFFIYISFQHFQKKGIDKKIKETLSLIGVLLIPCFMQVYFFRVHSWKHSFSALKFSIPLTTVPFILIPILIFPFLKIDLTNLSLVKSKVPFKYKNRKKYVDFKLPLVILCIVISVGIYLKNEHPHFKSLFPEANKSFEEIGKFIANNTEYKDIVFSTNFSIPRTPPQQLSYSMKRVYKVDTIFDICDKVCNIDENYEINIFSISKFASNNNYGIRELIYTAYDIKQIDDLYLYKIKKEKFYQTLSSYYYDREDIISEKVSLVDYSYRKIGVEKYKFYFLFKVNEEFEKDWKIRFRARVKDEDVNLLPKRRQKYKYCNWSFKPSPPTSAWRKNEYVVITRKVSAKPIVYNMNIYFFRRGEGRHGKEIELGWLNLSDKK